MTAVRYRIFGRVQMVGFRYFALRMAQVFDIRGYVKNLPDGSVLVTASGKKQDMDQFASRLAEGPPYASVERIEQEMIETVDDFPSGFSIR